MELSGHYDKEADVLAIRTGDKEADGSSAECDLDLAVFMGTKDGHDVVGFEIIGGGVYLRMEAGYDAEADTVTIGDTASDPSLITENGDLMVYWKADDEVDPAGFMNPIGVAVRNAKENMARVRIM